MGLHNQDTYRKLREDQLRRVSQEREYIKEMERKKSVKGIQLVRRLGALQGSYEKFNVILMWVWQGRWKENC